jgi:hypothetical protein
MMRTPPSVSPVAQHELVQPPMSPISLQHGEDGSDMDAEGEADVDDVGLVHLSCRTPFMYN